MKPRRTLPAKTPRLQKRFRVSTREAFRSGGPSRGFVGVLEGAARQQNLDRSYRIVNFSPHVKQERRAAEDFIHGLNNIGRKKDKLEVTRSGIVVPVTRSSRPRAFKKRTKPKRIRSSNKRFEP